MSRHKGFVVSILVALAFVIAVAGQSFAAEKTEVRVDGPDGDASLIGAVRLNPQLAYVGVSDLLEKHIKQQDEAAWTQIKEKIHYTYAGLSHALRPVMDKDNFKDRILAEIRAGKKLLIKPNLVAPRTLDLVGDGTPGSRISAYPCTDWAFIAALMRYFHDELGIPYYQMAIGEAGTAMPAWSALLKCTPEALIEGCGFERPEGSTLHAGWCLRWIRKYLAEETQPLDPRDDPQNGYSDSINGHYVTPGAATKAGKLMAYDLNNAEWFDRGRRVEVPDGGDNYKEGIVLHKAIVGDPTDPENYPGCVLVNAPILKVHSLSIHTNVIKNLGIGAWPMCAGHDSNPKTADWLYAYPPVTPTGYKGGVPGWEGGDPWKGGGVFHERWYVTEANEEGMSLKITDQPNMGIDGTMVDISLAIQGQVPCMLHVVDAVNVIDIEHGGAGGAVAREEGLVFASTDPVALDLLCARYMFTNVARNPYAPEQFARAVPVPRYDPSAKVIVTDLGLDFRVARSRLFDYAAKRGLGKVNYYVSGSDETTVAPVPLVSKDGHLGRIENWAFVDVMTDKLYFHLGGALYHLQTTLLAYAKATDQLTGSSHFAEFMTLDEDRDGIIDDQERGTKGAIDCVLGLLATNLSMMGRGEAAAGTIFWVSRFMKYSDPDWNMRRVDTMRTFYDARNFLVALKLATDQQTTGTDPFSGVPYGASDGRPKWPSLQFAKYTFELALLNTIYSNAEGLAKKTGKAFKLYVPKRVPYAPAGSSATTTCSYNPKSLPNVVELESTHPEYAKLVFTVEFSEAR